MEFLAGGGQMGAHVRAHDWSRSPVGHPSTWSASLRLIVQLLLNSGHPMYIWWGQELTCFYNDAYAQSLGPERHPESLGAPAREVWAEIWPVISPQIAQVMGGGPATWHENALVPVTRFGTREDVYWTYSYSPIGDPAAPSGVGGVLVVCTETTGQVKAEQRLAAQVEHQRQWFDQAPGFICVLAGPDHVYEFVNESYKRLVGKDEFVGLTVREVVPETSEQGFITLLDDVYRSGQRHVAHNTPIKLIRNAIEVECFLNFIYEPIKDEAGAVRGIFVEGFDTTGEHLAQQALQRQARHLALMVDELNHRVKNTLSIVQGLAYQTFRKDGVEASAVQAFDGRLMALARAHDVLTREKWEGADLGEIAGRALEVHGVDAARHSCSGPAVELEPQLAVNMAMLMHELATNALKHGALSNDAGTVEVSWMIEGAGQRRLLLEWIERGGPTVSPPSRRGFGTTMIDRMKAAEPDSQMGLEFTPLGVVCRLQIDLPCPADAVAG